MEEEPENLCLGPNTADPEDKLIRSKFEYIKEETREVEECLEQLEEESQALEFNQLDRVKLERVIQLRESQSHNCSPTEDKLAIDKNLKELIWNLDSTILQRKTRIQEYLSQIKTKSTEVILCLTTVQEKHLDDIRNWRIEQRRYEGDKENETLQEKRLYTIERSCETLAELFMKFRVILKNAENVVNKLENGPKDLLSQELHKDLLGNLVMASFIVAKQPPRVCKRNSRIQSVILRLLVGRGLNLHSTPIDIKASLIDEHQLGSLLQNSDFKLPQVPSRPMSNNVQCLKSDKENTSRWSANFKNICIQRNLNGMQEYKSVFDAKYWFCFETTFIISNLEFSIWTLSHPIVLISNGNQICHALATITWDNCVTSGDVYVAPALENVVKAPWSKLAVELNKQWRSVTGCHLTEDHLNYLETKVSGADQSVVTKQKFCMYKLGDTNYTFWEWFFHVIQKVKADKSLVSLAKADMLHGWISRARSEALLANSSNPGTFITRFSESNIGKFIITFVHTDKSILHTMLDYQPHIKSFANVLRECTFLTHVYAMTPLRPTLDRILEPLDMSRNTGRGYVKPLMRYVIPGITDSLADETHVPVHDDAFSVDELGNVELDMLLDEIGTLEPENFIEIENLFPMENSLPFPDSTNDVVSHADNTIYTNLDESTLEFRTSETPPLLTVTPPTHLYSSESCSSSSLVEEAIPETDMDLQSATDSSNEFSASGNGVKGCIKQKRWQKPDGFIIHKRKRDQAKYKQRKALQQRAKDLTKTCGSRVFLMVEDKILCDSLDGGQDVASIPEYVYDQFRHRTPVVIPEEVVTRLRNMHIGNIKPCSAASSGILKKKTRRCKIYDEKNKQVKGDS